MVGSCDRGLPHLRSLHRILSGEGRTLRIVFAGTPEPAVASLQAVLQSDHEVVAVVTRPPARSGRGRTLQPSPVGALAAASGIPVLTPARPRDPEFHAEFRKLAPEAVAVVAYGAILPQSLLDIPPHGWINLHFSLLPAWRGAAPVQAAVRHGDDITGASTFRIEVALDTGPLYGTVTETIRPDDTAGALLERLSFSGAKLLVATLDGIEAGALEPVPQPAAGVSYAPKITVSDAELDWHKPAMAIDRLARSVTPDPGAWTTFRGERLGLGPLARTGLPAGELRPGVLAVSRTDVLVGTATTPLRLGTVIPPGKRAMPAADWARGTRPGPGRALRSTGVTGPIEGRQAKGPLRSGQKRPAEPAAAEEARRSGRRRIWEPRSAALEVLEAVRVDGAYANLALPAILAASGMDQRDRALATDLAYGTCRALGLLDAVLAQCVDRPLGDLDGTVHDVLRLGAYQLLRTRIPAHAAVATAVDLVRSGARPGATGLVNAVLRKVAARTEDEWVALVAPPAHRDPVGNAAVRSAHPRWIAQAFADALGTTGPELADALAADDTRPLVHLVARPGRITTEELAAATGGTPARYSPFGVYLDEGNPGEIAAIREGRAAVQDEGSQLVALALVAAPLNGPDERWLDLAAGPGGKAGLLGAIAADRGARVDAVEVNEHRANMVRHTVRGLPVTVHQADGRDPGLDPGYDRILLDAPCTGLGALRRRPEARWRRSPADVQQLVDLQRELLASACRLVRVGGVIGYVTCSPHLDETVRVAQPSTGFTLVDARPLFPRSVPALGPGPTVQLWPHRHGTDAMFLALLRRDS